MRVCDLYPIAHGTGTLLGDMIEGEAIRGVFGDRAKPLYISSSKTVLGHCQAAAAFVGMYKFCFVRDSMQ